MVVNSDYAKENPDVVEAVEDAWYKAVNFLNENPDQAYEEMADFWKEKGECETDDLADFFELVK